MNIKEIRHEFGDCDWMRAFLNGYAVDAVLWLMDQVEEHERMNKKIYIEIEAVRNMIHKNEILMKER